ncbi:hypothetical protein BT69DRAFT_906524 [Atractiella rhizophila]|nr:hypothetical protein BT69DRAFT_906524 [Atractiella rhizophila]
MAERREIVPASLPLRHLLSPPIPSRPTSIPLRQLSPFTSPSINPPPFFALWPRWVFPSAGSVPRSAFLTVPLHLLSHSTGPHASTKPVTRKLNAKWRLNVR